MLDRLLTFLKDLPAGGPARRGARAADDPRVAAAALMIHVMDADGVRRSAESERLRETLTSVYGVAGDELDALLQAGEQADQEAIDLYAFTSVVKRHLDEAARIAFIEMLWDVVYADGERHELEDNIVWRVAELIGVSGRARVETRQRARSRAPAVVREGESDQEDEADA
ncbi:MAG: TerB family tellurite resistance protein [Mesorhizobium sp.]|jgi:uncharacterized tellurite resistance protein B-like protein